MNQIVESKEMAKGVEACVRKGRLPRFARKPFGQWLDY